MPQPLDLLLYLLDRADTLVTKGALLEALWPNVTVTDNALTRAVSELRQALGDDAHTSRFITTIPRRGYRFIAPVERIEASSGSGQASPLASVTADDDRRTVAVLDFVNVVGEPQWAWLERGIAETVTGDLRALGRFRVIDRSRITEARRCSNGSLQAMATDLRAGLFVHGSFQRTGRRIRITARLVNPFSGEAIADAKVDGPLSEIFALQDQVVEKFSRVLGFARPPNGIGSPMRETSSLDAYRAWTEGWLKIESLDTRLLQRAIEDFSHAVSSDSRYASAFAGLATAEFALYESTRFDADSGDEFLEDALTHARRAIELEDGLADAHATLAMILVSSWRTPEAAVSARRAVVLEPYHWRHVFRLCHATWGEVRLSAADQTLALYPGFAFAHFQMAMVFVARGLFAQANTVLLQGVEMQDRQTGQQARFPALGLHWLHGLVRLAQEDMAQAIVEFDRELQMADTNRLYGREYAMDALQGRGFAQLRLRRFGDAIDDFERALTVYPKSVSAQIGLAKAFQGLGRDVDANRAFVAAEQAIVPMKGRRPIECSMATAQLLSGRGQCDAAAALLESCLTDAPPGFAGWTVPIDPLFLTLHGLSAFSSVLRRLATRAR